MSKVSCFLLIFLMGIEWSVLMLPSNEDEENILVKGDGLIIIDQQQQQRSIGSISGRGVTNASITYYEILSRKMNLIISPILLFIGGIGNPLCIVILLRKCKPNSTIVYLCLLAVFDILVLYTGLLRLYLKDLISFDVRNVSTLFCKLHIFLTYTFMQISSYILVSVTINRLCVTYNRTITCKRKLMTNPNADETTETNKAVYIIFTFICAAVTIWNLQLLVFYELTPEGKGTVGADDCSIDKSLHSKYYEFRTNWYSQLSFYIFIMVPCAILFIANLLIIKKIMQLANPRLRRNTGGAGSITSSGGHAPPRSEDVMARKKERKKMRLSIMLLAVCLWFMVLKTPASVYTTFSVEEMKKPYFKFTYMLFMLINYTNHAINLILYILTSATFRRDFKQFFCLSSDEDARRRQSINPVAMTTTAVRENGRNSVTAAMITPHVLENLKMNNMPIEVDYDSND